MMEGIVYGIANINFRQNIDDFCDENCTPNYITMAATPAENIAQKRDLDMIENTQNINLGDICSQQPIRDDDNDSWDEGDDEETNNGSFGYGNLKSYKGQTFAERRQLPSRNAKDRSLLGTKRRTIMKPKRVSLVHRDSNSLKPSDLKKIYSTKKKLPSFKPASLETIIEEESADNPSNDCHDDYHSKQVQFLGTRKFRRAMTFNDCFYVSNTLKKKRRAKIKKVLGRRPALKKISFEEFFEKLNKSMEEKQITDTMPSEEMDEGYCHQETATVADITNLQ